MPDPENPVADAYTGATPVRVLLLIPGLIKIYLLSSDFFLR
jgi:hypothetical protein